MFCAPHLHIDSTTAAAKVINGHAAPLAGVIADIDGRTRNSVTPDIGAHEFDVFITTPMAGMVWTKDARNPVLAGGGWAAWEPTCVQSKRPLQRGFSALRMYAVVGRNREVCRFFPARIGFAVSKTPVNWTVYPTAVLSPSQGTWTN